MKKLKALAKRAVGLLRSAYWKYPARTLSYIAAALIFAGAQLGVAVEQATLLQALAYAAPILLAGEATHRKVTPV